jgi:hypothetical protein
MSWYNCNVVESVCNLRQVGGFQVEETNVQGENHQPVAGYKHFQQHYSYTVTAL